MRSHNAARSSAVKTKATNFQENVSK
jgi:hypothetical protein